MTENNYNLIFIYTDQQATSTLGAYGNEKIDTPNLDRLAEESVTFERAYCTQPVCTPSRSSILSGLYPHTNGCINNSIPLAEEIPAFPELGDFAEYKTAHYGKWHLGDEVFAQHGFQEWKSVLDRERRFYSRDKEAHSTYHDFLIKNGFKPDIKEDGNEYFSRNFSASLAEEYSKPAYLAGEANSFIRENKNNPFILYLSFFEPHAPNTSCRDEQYSPEEVSLPDNFNLEPETGKHEKINLLKNINSSDLSPDDWKEQIAKYWGLVSLIDTQLGKVLTTLKECELEEDTIIVFTSDHGHMAGSHGLFGKTVMFEEAIRIPLMLKIPGITDRGQRISAPVSQIDIVPTLLSAMGETVPGHLQGESLLSNLKKGIPLRRDVFVEWNGDHPWGKTESIIKKSEKPDWKGPEKTEIKEIMTDPIRTIITPEGWKYNHSQRGDHELYNLKKDPGETENLYGKCGTSSMVKNLRKKIKEWQEETADNGQSCWRPIWILLDRFTKESPPHSLLFD